MKNHFNVGFRRNYSFRHVDLILLTCSKLFLIECKFKSFFSQFTPSKKLESREGPTSTTIHLDVTFLKAMAILGC